MFDVLCLSDCCCDIIFKGLNRIPEPGTEEYCEKLYCKAGGGSNTAMGLAKLGCDTAYATVIGNDSFGEIIASGLAAAGVKNDYVLRPNGAQTWVSAVLSTGSDRAFASYAGQGISYTYQELCTMVESSRWVHTYLYYCERFPMLTSLCREKGVPLSVDSTFIEGQTLKDICPILKQTALFTPNETEACALTRTDDPSAALMQLSSVCPNVVITMGKKGCLAALDGGRYHVVPPEVQAVDANGAGDLFNAGLLAARLSGKDTCEQLCWAAASGALAVTYAGGMDDSYTREKTEKLASYVKVNLI
jgi:sugar/nucleoside kinase (ribokinase family)